MFMTLSITTVSRELLTGGGGGGGGGPRSDKLET